MPDKLQNTNYLNCVSQFSISVNVIVFFSSFVLRRFLLQNLENTEYSSFLALFLKQKSV